MGIKDFFGRVNEIVEKENCEVNNFEKLPRLIVYDEKKVCGGYRLYNGILVDSSGNLIQKYDFKYIGILTKDFYIAQKAYENSECGVFSKDGKKIWTKTNTIHHDIQITPRDTIITLDKEMRRYKGRMVDFDVIVEYDINGKELWRFSIWDNLKKFQKLHCKLTLDFPKIGFLDFARRKDKSPWGGYYDYYHLNSCTIIPENLIGKKDKRFKEGNIILSFRHGSMIFILDRSDVKNEIVWSITQKDILDEIQGQHGVHMLKNGNMLMFDNGRYRRWSRALEINPVNLQIVWEYRGKEPFFTDAQGYAQRLTNGNTLITISESGRVIEVTKKGEVVWEFNNPEVQNKSNSKFPKWYGKPEWIYRMTHYDKF